jgi:hypothetical protein
MRHIFRIVLAFAVGITLAACSGTTPTSSVQANASTSHHDGAAPADTTKKDGGGFLGGGN